MTSRTTVGGRHGYTIEKVVVKDEDGKVIKEIFELHGPGGHLIGSYPSLDDAEAALDDEIDPSPGSGMGM